LKRLMECCERLLGEQTPAPFRSVLPDRYVEEIIRLNVTKSTPYGDATGGAAHPVNVPNDPLSVGQMFSALDSLIGGQTIYGSSCWSDCPQAPNLLCTPTLQMWSNVFNMLTLPRTSTLWPISSFDSVGTLPRTEEIGPKSKRQKRGSKTESASNTIQPRSAAQLMEYNDHTVVETQNPQTCLRDSCSPTKRHHISPDNVDVTTGTIMKPAVTSTSLFSATTTLIRNEMQSAPVETQKHLNLPDLTSIDSSNVHCAGFKSLTVQAPEHPNSLDLLTNLMLLTALFQQVCTPGTGTGIAAGSNTVPAAQGCSSGSSHPLAWNKRMWPICPCWVDRNHLCSCSRFWDCCLHHFRDNEHRYPRD
uniref:SERTA domain-containing protein n=1 Tax=Echinostoma caproni TaxID=27848 RepID=A0A183ANI3_9TREM